MTRLTHRRTLQPAVGGTALLLALSACSSSAGASSAGDVKGTVTVFAAASLKESFTELGTEFEAAHPGTKVSFNFGGSDALAASITSGAPADVFAAASPKTMQIVTDANDAAGEPATFVRNQLEIAVVPGNPEDVTSLKDLTNSGIKVALCAKEVPAEGEDDAEAPAESSEEEQALRASSTAVPPTAS